MPSVPRRSSSPVTVTSMRSAGTPIAVATIWQVICAHAASAPSTRSPEPPEVLAPPGQGGMGAVDRARDTRLGREVAIKILPAAFASNVERLQRLEQEARSASALNHPNIVTIYEVGSADSTFYIAMELIEGASLRDLVLAGPLPVRRLLSIAAQLADGLAKAHGAGIVP